MKCDTYVLFLLSLPSLSIVHSAEKCCKNERIKNYRTCDDGKEILPSCEGARSLLNNEWSFYSKYIIHNDSVGEYLENYIGAYIIRSPHFCVGQRKRIFTPNVSDPVAVICTTNRVRYRDLNIPIDDSDNEEFYLSYYSLIDIVGNFISCSLLAVAFYVYYLVIPVRQIEDDCLLNFVGNMVLSHASFLYDNFSDEGVLPELCITNLYVAYYFTLSGFAWYALFMYYLWKKCKSGISQDQAVALKQFRIIGYGVPALFIILVNIHAHVSKLYSDSQFELDCLTHQILMEDIYIYGPLILAIGLNCYFWKNLKIHIETTAVKTTEDDSNKKKINSMLTLNRRILLALAIPWLGYTISNGTYEVIESETVATLGLYASIGASCAGGIVALILVMSRARVWKCVTHKYDNYEWLQKWQPSDQEEISTLYKNGSFSVSQTFPSDV